MQKKFLKTVKVKNLLNDHHIYDHVSCIYNGLMEDVNYYNWADYLKDVIAQFTSSKGPVLELASGTCNLAVVLRKFYSEVVATDISLNMLKISEDTELKKVCCDMICLPIKSKFPVIISAFDSINYLLTERKILQLFNEVKNILTNDGVFTFDASLVNNSLDHVKDSLKKGKIDGILFNRRSKFNKQTRIHKNIFEIYDESNKRHKEIHKQKIYDFETYFDLVYKSGLKVVECYETFTFKQGNTESPRVQFVIKKVN